MNILPHMAQTTVNERIKFLIDSLGVSARRFSELVGESYSNMNNYVSERQSMPPASLLEKVLLHFESIDPKWLVLGIGEPFIGEAPIIPVTVTNKKNKGPVQSSTGSHATNNITNNIKLDECHRDLEASRKEAAGYQREIELLKGQLEDKNEIITLLRGGYNRPN